MTSDKKVQLRWEDVVWREVDDDLVVLELSTSTYLTLNGAAKHLWKCLADGATVEQLAESLAQRYQIPSDQARSDTESFLGELADRALLVVDA